MEKSSSSSKGIGFLSILTLIFVIAKITGFINWSWWLVFSPTILSVVLALIIIMVAIFVTWLSD